MMGKGRREELLIQFLKRLGRIKRLFEQPTSLTVSAALR